MELEGISLRKILIAINVIFLIILIFSALYAETYDCNGMYFLKYFVFVQYVLIVLTTRIYFKWTHSYMLFLFSFGMFLLGRVFLDLIGLVDIQYANKVIYYTISKEVISKVLLLLGIGLGFINLGVLLQNKERKINQKIVKGDKTNLFRQLYLIAVILLLPGTLYKMLYDYKQVLEYGYLVFFNDDWVPAPLFARLSWLILKSLLPLFLMINPNKKEFRYFILLALIIDLTSIVTGNRSTLIAPFAFLIWYYFKFYSSKSLKLWWISVFAGVIIIFSIVSINLRDKVEVEKLNIPLYTQLFFNSQGVTFTIMAYYFDFHDKLPNPSALAPFKDIHDYYLRFQMPIAHTVEYAERTLSLDHKITYAVSQKKYLSGAGLGSNFLIELFEMGGWLTVCIGCFFLGKIIVYLEFVFEYYSQFRFLSWFWIIHLMETSRASLLPALSDIIFTIILLYFIKQLMNIKRRYFDAKN